MKRGPKLLLVLVPLVASGLLTLSACTPLVTGGVATSAAITNDKRTTGTVIEDQAIENKAQDFFKADGALAEQARLNVTSYNQMVLLTGEVPTEELRKRAVEYVSRVSKVRHVHNEITIGSPIPAGNRANDALLTTKVKAKLVSIKDISALDVKVVTSASVVYLMGLVDKPTGDAIAEAVATVGGISKVVKLFEG